MGWWWVIARLVGASGLTAHTTCWNVNVGPEFTQLPQPGMKVWSGKVGRVAAPVAAAPLHTEPQPQPGPPAEAALVAHSATQYKGLSVCLSVPPYQINCCGLKNESFEFLMASLGFHMDVQASISFHNLPLASNIFQYVPLDLIECII